MKSADDSPHQNYIHPEKYTGVGKTKPGKKSILNSSISASLDDLISEGALLGSDEDFDRFLDDKGNVLSDAKFSKEKADEKTNEKPLTKPAEAYKPLHGSGLKKNATKLVVEEDAAVLSPVDSTASVTTKPLNDLENYSTPNLSEYQIGHQISDHSQLLDSVKSYDLSKLPTSDDTESRSKTNDVYPAVASSAPPVRPSNMRTNSGIATNKLFDAGQNAQVLETDSLHTPYFQSDERPSSRSRSRVAFRDQSRERSRSRSRSTSVVAPHLARGDSYKNTHEETPSKYELPAGMKVEEDDEEPEDRRSRQSKPTLGDSIAAAEAKKLDLPEVESVTRDPSLVTSGDYTNFNADGHDHVFKGSNLYSLRSESSTNYLRSISRSRSRKPVHDIGSLTLNEKVDSNTKELEREGALVSDDPFSQVENLDNMMQTVLKGSTEKAAPKSKNLVNDVSAEEKSTEAKKQLKTETVPTVTADSIDSTKVDASIKKQPAKDVPDSKKDANSKNAGEIKPPVSAPTDKTVPEKLEISSKEEDSQPKAVVNDVSAEEKKLETEDQLKADCAPLVSADDIDVTLVKSKVAEGPTSKAEKDEKDEKKTVKSVSTEKKETKADEPKKDGSPDVSASDKHVTKAETGGKKIETPVEGKSKEAGAKKPDVTAEEKTLSEKVIEGIAGVKENVKESMESKLDTPTTNAIKENVKGLFGGSSDEKIESTEKPVGAESSVTKSISGTAPKELKLASKPVEKEEEFEVSTADLRKHLESLPVYIYTSLAGGMQIITRTNRLVTILQANGIKFEHRDLGTDEEAKKLWRRYAQGKTLPGVVRGDDFIGNWEDIEEVNEDYRLKEVLHETL